MTATVETHAPDELVLQARRGDRMAADRLVRDHDRWLRSVVYAVCGRADLVDDIVQQVWARVWERLGTLRDPSRLRAWLCHVARNAAIDAGVARRRRPETNGLDPSAEAAGADEGGSPEHAAISDETRARLLDAVRGLPAIYREPFVLRHLEDWTYAEIAEVLDLTVETVETRLVRARRLLREALMSKVAS